MKPPIPKIRRKSYRNSYWNRRNLNQLLYQVWHIFFNRSSHQLYEGNFCYLSDKSNRFCDIIKLFNWMCVLFFKTGKTKHDVRKVFSPYWKKYTWWKIRGNISSFCFLNKKGGKLCFDDNKSIRSDFVKMFFLNWFPNWW